MRLEVMAYPTNHCANCGSTDDLQERRVVAAVSDVTVWLCAGCRDKIKRAMSDAAKTGMDAARARGVKFGGPVGRPPIASEAQRLGSQRGLEVRSAKARAHAETVRPHIEALRDKGITSLSGLARGLTEAKVPLPGGGAEWHASTVQRVLSQLGEGR
jgi:hypothetical protein